jgi:hypothetical protein
MYGFPFGVKTFGGDVGSLLALRQPVEIDP